MICRGCADAAFLTVLFCVFHSVTVYLFGHSVPIVCIIITKKQKKNCFIICVAMAASVHPGWPQFVLGRGCVAAAFLTYFILCFSFLLTVYRHINLCIFYVFYRLFVCRYGHCLASQPSHYCVYRLVYTVLIVTCVFRYLCYPVF